MMKFKWMNAMVIASVMSVAFFILVVFIDLLYVSAFGAHPGGASDTFGISARYGLGGAVSVSFGAAWGVLYAFVERYLKRAGEMIG